MNNQYNTSNKVIVPVELDRLNYILKLELILVISGFFIVGLFYTLFNDSINNLFTAILLVLLIVVPLIYFYLNQRIIYNFRNLIIPGQFLFKVQTYFSIIFSIIFLFVGFFYYHNNFPILIAFLIAFLFFVTPIVLKILYFNNVKGVTILWNQPFRKKWKMNINIINWTDQYFKSIINHYIFFLGYFTLVTILFFGLTSGLTIKTDIVNLLHGNLSSVQSLNKFQKDFGGSDHLIIGIETDEALDDKKKFEKINQVKILNEYKLDKNGKNIFVPRINKHGIITAKDEVLIRRNYYYKHFHDNNKDLSIKKKIYWKADLDKTKRFVEELSKRLSNDPVVSYCEYKLPLQFLNQNLLLYSDISDLALIDSRLRMIKREVLTRKDGVINGLQKIKSINDIFTKFIKKKNIKLHGNLGNITNDGFYLSGDNRLLVIFIKPKQNSSNIEYCKLFIRNVDKIVKQTIKELQVNNEFHESIKIGYGGNYKRIQEESENLLKDIDIAIFLGWFIIIGLLVVYFKGLSPVFLIGIPVFITLVWTIGITRITTGNLNIITSFLMMILGGIDIIIGIHILSRYYERRENGNGVADSLSIAINKTGMVSLLALITSIVVLFILFFSGIKAINQLAYIAILGIIIIFLGMFHVLPILIFIYERIINRITKYWYIFENNIFKIILYSIISLLFILNVYLIINYSIIHKPISIIFIPNELIIFPYLFLLQLIIFAIKSFDKKYTYNTFSIVNWLINKSKLIVILSTIVIIFSLITLKWISFDYDFLNVLGKKSNSYRFEEKIHEKLDLPSNPVFVVIDNIDEEREIYEALLKVKDYSGDQSLILYIDSLGAYIPENQPEKIELIKDIKNIVADLLLQFKKEKFDVRENKNNHDISKNIVREIHDQTNNWRTKYLSYIPEQLSIDQIPVALKRKFMKLSDATEKRTLIIIYPKKNLIYSRASLKHFINEIRNVKTKEKWLSMKDFQDRMGLNLEHAEKQINIENLKTKYENNIKKVFIVSKNISISGELLAIHDILIHLESDFSLIILALIAIILIVYFYFKSIIETIIVLIPLFAGMTILIGLMFIVKLQFNLLNITVFPLFIFLGINSSVHIYQRYREEGFGGLSFVIKKTGLTIFRALLAMILVFGSLIFTNHRGMNSIGFIAILGISAILITSVLLLPAVLKIWEDKFKSIH